MKRIIGFLMAALLLCGVSCAEETAVVISAAECTHVFILDDQISDEHLWCIGDSEAEPSLFVSAKCYHCGAEAIVFEDETLLEADPCDPDECTHRLLCSDIGAETNWSLQNEDELHGLHINYGTCIDCGTAGILEMPLEVFSLEKLTCEHEFVFYADAAPEYERDESCGNVNHAHFVYYQGVCRYCGTLGTVAVMGIPELHSWSFTGQHQHRGEQGVHEYIYSCSVCDEMYSEMYPCPQYDDEDCVMNVYELD